MNLKKPLTITWSLLKIQEPFEKQCQNGMLRKLDLDKEFILFHIIISIVFLYLIYKYRTLNVQGTQK